VPMYVTHVQGSQHQGIQKLPALMLCMMQSVKQSPTLYPGDHVLLHGVAYKAGTNASRTAVESCEAVAHPPAHACLMMI
jgi:hypothetical protein